MESGREGRGKEGRGDERERGMGGIRKKQKGMGMDGRPKILNWLQACATL